MAPVYCRAGRVHDCGPGDLLALCLSRLLLLLLGGRRNLRVVATYLRGRRRMNSTLPLIVAVLIFPICFLGSKLRTRRHGYAVPLVFGAVLLSATLISGDPMLPTLLFVVVAIGIAWRWWSTAHSIRGDCSPGTRHDTARATEPLLVKGCCAYRISAAVERGAARRR